MTHEQIKNYLLDLIFDIANTDVNVILLCVLLVACFIVLDAVGKHAKASRIKAGMNNKSSHRTQILPELKSLPVRHYISDMQGLAGKPDGLVSENGYIIPIECKPLAKKIRDRYVAQLLVYMRLVEEFEGKKPPYGYLVLGKKSRKVKIYNSEKRQAWLQEHLDQMRVIVEENASVVPQPSIPKCKRCNVRHRCNFKVGKQADLINIGQQAVSEL